MVTCRHCKEKLTRDEAVNPNPRQFYHSNCWELLEQQQAIAQRDAEEYKRLIAYICELRRWKSPSGAVLQQIKRFKEEFGYRYEGMRLALYYFHEIKGMPILEDKGVGIIPSIYDEARQYYQKLQRIKRSAREFDTNNIQYVEPSRKTAIDREPNLINIEDL